MQLPKLGVLLLVTVASCLASANSNWTIGIKGGFGGMGITKETDVGDSTREVSFSESPAMIGLSVGTLLSDKFALVFEHRRGFRLGPLSFGLGVTDATCLWYFLRPAPGLIRKGLTNYLLNRTWTPFVGASAGIAFGRVSREGQAVDSVSTSGATIGFRGGADYHYQSNSLLRAEAIFSQTLLNSSQVPSSISEFGLLMSYVFAY